MKKALRRKQGRTNAKSRYQPGKRRKILSRLAMVIAVVIVASYVTNSFYNHMSGPTKLTTANLAR